MKRDDELISEIIRTELSRYRFFFSDDEKLMIRNGNYLDLATGQLEKLSLYIWLVVALIVLFSGWAVYLFIDYGQTVSIFSLVLGLITWVVVVILTYLFTKEIIVKKRSMEMIIDLLNR